MPRTNMIEGNLRPGRSKFGYAIRRVANGVRSWLIFRIRYPWVRRTGMVRIPWSVEFWSPHYDISLGDRVQFGPNSMIQCDAKIGNNVLIGRYVALIGRDDHTFDVTGKTIWDSPRGDTHKVIIEDDVLIGQNTIIQSGVTIGRGAIVGAGSVITKDVPRYSIGVGNPARVVRWRFTPDQIIRHEEILGYSDRTKFEDQSRKIFSSQVWPDRLPQGHRDDSSVVGDQQVPVYDHHPSAQRDLLGVNPKG